MNYKHKIWLKLSILSVCVMFLILVIVGMTITHSKDLMMKERKNQIRSVVESAISVAEFYNRKAKLGEITLEEAKEKTKDIVRSIRYGKYGYLFIYNTNGITEAHAFSHELEGKYRMDLKDAKGVPYIRNQIEKAKNGGGFTYYHYKKPNSGSNIYPKMVYDKLFSPWNWVFVTGVYIDDINRDFFEELKGWIGVLSPVFFLLISLTYFLARTITKPLYQLENSIDIANKATKAKSNFLSNMSHEIRAPLNGAMGMIALILGTKMTASQKEWATTAYKSCEELLNLINDILDISKVETEKMMLEKLPFDLQALVKSVTEIMYPKANKKDLEIIVAFQSDLPRYVVGDFVRLQQILINLVSNAIKFTQEGYILISVEGHQNGDNYNLKFEIKDTGMGIPLDMQDYIFEKFFQVEENGTCSYGGTGLGLALCRKLTGLMGGEIGVRSSQGEGSTFWFTVVLGFEKGLPSVSSSSPHDNGEKILIDYSHSFIRKTIISHLRNWAYASIDAHQGGGLLNMLRQDASLGQPYDFAVVEVPEHFKTKEELEDYINSIYNASPNTNIILIISPNLIYNYNDISLKSCVAVLTKPAFPQELFDAINKLVSYKRDNKRPCFITFSEERPIDTKNTNINVGDEKIILVAEDQKVNQMLMKTVLMQFGYDVNVVSDGVEAVRLVAKNKYDLIFMDCHMPKMSGLEATKQIREFEVRLKRHTPIIALTADAMKGDREKCLSVGMDDYIHKPVKALHIKEMVEKYTKNK